MAWSSPHAVEATMNTVPGLQGSLASTFTNLANVAPQYQAASFEAGIEQARGGLEAAKDTRVALASAVKNNPDATAEASTSGPGFIKEGLMMGGGLAMAAAFPQMAPALAAVSMVSATVGAIKNMSNPIDREYQSSSFTEYKKGDYEDAFGFKWGEDGAALPSNLGGTAPAQPQPALMRAARDMVDERGADKVLKDLAKASRSEDKLNEQLGSHLEFAEKNAMKMPGQASVSGFKPPSWAVA